MLGHIPDCCGTGSGPKCADMMKKCMDRLGGKGGLTCAEMMKFMQRSEWFKKTQADTDKKEDGHDGEK